MIIVICGSSVSGKTTIVQALHQYGYAPATTSTTRKPRNGERDAVNYKFLSVRKFLDEIQMNTFEEITTYGKELYGSPRINPRDNTVIVLDYVGFKYYKNKYPKQVIGVYLDISPETALQHLGGSNIQRINRTDFSIVNKEAFDIIIEDIAPVDEIVEEIITKLDYGKQRIAV